MAVIISQWRSSADKAPVMEVVMKTVSKHVPDMKLPTPGTPGRPFSIPNVDILVQSKSQYFLIERAAVRFFILFVQLLL